MWYANTWTNNERAIDMLVEATKALGKVLSTPVGVIMLEDLELSRWSEKQARADYEQMIDAGKRPTKTREDARAKYESYGGESYAMMNALSCMVVEASGYKVSNIAARRTISYELRQINDVDLFDPNREAMRKLRRRCMNLVYA